jgi:hypothetical protein
MLFHRTFIYDGMLLPTDPSNLLIRHALAPAVRSSAGGSRITKVFEVTFVEAMVVVCDRESAMFGIQSID